MAISTLLLLAVLGADPHAPKGIKDSDKWLAAKIARKKVEDQRIALTKKMLRQKHLQQADDRRQRIRNYPWYLHPSVRSQQQMAVIQSMAIRAAYARMPTSYYPLQFGFNYSDNNYRQQTYFHQPYFSTSPIQPVPVPRPAPI